MTTFTLTHADIVTRDTVFKDGSLVVEDGHIASVGGASKGNEIDLSGQWLLPGLIDLHCDAIEKEVEPRPGVLMPLDLAIRQIDTRNLVAGISTIFHCFSFAGEELGVRNPELATRIARLVASMSEGLSVRNLVHARFEVSHPEAMPLVSELMRDEVISLLSFMDHTPGQGQFREDGAYKRFLMKTYQKTDEEAVALIDAKSCADDGSGKVVDTLARQALSSGVGLISHDDDTPEKVRQMHDLGVRISEFPVTLEAGCEARRLGMHALVGAPNVVRGRSQSGGVSALDALADGAANCLCSDYIPATILPAVFQVPERLGWDLPEAVALATANPAEAVGLFDRGHVAEGKLADLIVVNRKDEAVEITDMWVGGNPRLSRSGGKWN